MGRVRVARVVAMSPQLALFDVAAPVAPLARVSRPRRERVRREQLRMVLPGEHAPPPRDEAGRDIERLVRLHQRALRKRVGVRDSRQALMDRIAPLVIQAVRRRHAASASGSSLTLDDAIQDCLLWVMQQVDRYRGTTHLQGRSLIAAWIRMLVSQRMFLARVAADSPVVLTRRDEERIRAERQRAEAEGLEPEASPHAVELQPEIDAGDTPEALAMDDEEAREADGELRDMWRMVGRLPVEQRRLMRRIHRDGLELAEAAQREGITAHRAGRLYRRALEQLREWAC